MSELLPCPFCGGEAELHDIEDYPNRPLRDWYVNCRQCNVTMPSVYNSVHTEAEAVAAWNRRVAPQWPTGEEAAERLARTYAEVVGLPYFPPIAQDFAAVLARLNESEEYDANR